MAGDTTSAWGVQQLFQCLGCDFFAGCLVNLSDLPGERAGKTAPQPVQAVENCCKSPYDNDADEFVRRNCRDRTGWRRDEWAYSPLFIWGNSGLTIAVSRSPGASSAFSLRGKASRSAKVGHAFRATAQRLPWPTSTTRGEHSGSKTAEQAVRVRGPGERFQPAG